MITFLWWIYQSPMDPHTFSGTVRKETIYVGARVGPVVPSEKVAVDP